LVQKALLFGSAAAVMAGLYGFLVPQLPEDSWVRRYLANHPIEYWTVGLFLAGVALLGDRGLQTWRERQALRRAVAAVTPPDSFLRKPPREVLRTLSQHLPSWAVSSLAGQRLLAALECVAQGRSSQETAALLRDIASQDADRLERSQSSIRFITWAIPILGFLGTVLGITSAIAHVTPEHLEKSLSGVTAGLAVAFDTTALALSLSIVLMLLASVVDRAERSLLGRLDQFATFQLLPLVQSIHPEAGPQAPWDQLLERLFQATAQAWEQERHEWSRTVQQVARQQVQLLQEASGRLLEQLRLQAVRHHEDWQAGLEKLEQVQLRTAASAVEALSKEADRLVRSIAAQTERFLGVASHTVEELHGSAATLLRQLHQLSSSWNGQLHRLEAILGQGIDRFAQYLTKWDELCQRTGELQALQQALHQNLTALTTTAALDEAVQALTAAVHLLSLRATHSAREMPPALPAERSAA
jgi:hypothetical protein